MNKFLLVLIVFALSSCQNNTKEKGKEKVETVSSEIELIEMPEDLEEISGITFVNDSLVAAVEDENGVLYFFDIAKKEIIREFTFAEKGDYEDLTRNGNDIYVIRADGIIYEIANFAAEHPQVTYFKTPLKSKNDIEGLAYDKENHRLLLAVKEKNLNQKDKEHEFKDIYQFTLDNKIFDSIPVMRINLKQIEDKFKEDGLTEASKKFLKAIGNENINEIIKPTALTYHPTNGKLYVLSAGNNFIVTLNPDGSFADITRFSGKEFMQPEGIAFNSKGELYISNEGKKNKGNIIKLIK
ncbi:MAG TPA: SdiA-regulated domain-containing protein [Pelobium sp.]|nr:SdiA-regulated domain-containing protein [Pelobium sp.]